MSAAKPSNSTIDAVTLFKVLGLLLAILVHVYYGTKNFDFLKFQKLWVSMQYGVQLLFLFGGYHVFKTAKKNNFNIAKLFKHILVLYVAYVFLMGYFIWENTMTGRMVYPSIKYAVLAVSLNLTLLQSVLPSICNGIVPGAWIASCFLLFSIIIYVLAHKISSLEVCLKFLLLTVLVRFLLVEILLPIMADRYTFNLSYFAYANLFNHLPVFFLGIIFYYCKQISFKIVSFVIPSTYILTMLFLIQMAIGHSIFFPAHLEFALVFILMFLLVTPSYILDNRYIVTILKLFKSSTLVIYFCHFPMIFLLQKIGLFDMVTSVYVSIALNYILTLIMTLLFAKLVTFLITIIYRPCINLEA